MGSYSIPLAQRIMFLEGASLGFLVSAVARGQTVTILIISRFISI